MHRAIVSKCDLQSSSHTRHTSGIHGPQHPVPGKRNSGISRNNKSIRRPRRSSRRQRNSSLICIDGVSSGSVSGNREAGGCGACCDGERSADFQGAGRDGGDDGTGGEGAVCGEEIGG